MHGRGFFDFRTDEEKVRDLTLDFIEACRDRDFDEIWELHSSHWHRAMTFTREQLKRNKTPFPEEMDDEELFLHLLEDFEEPPKDAEDTLLAPPWLWPDAWLDDLRIEKVAIGPIPSTPAADGEAEAILLLARKVCGAFEPYDVRLIFVRDGKQWRVDSFEARAFRLPEKRPPLPDVRREMTDDGRSLLAARIGFKHSQGLPDGLVAALAESPSGTRVRLEAAEDVEMATLGPWLLAIAQAGCPEVVLRPCPRSPLRRGYVIQALASQVHWVEDGDDEDANDLLIGIPDSAPGAICVLPVGAGGLPLRSNTGVPGEMTFFTHPEEAGELKDKMAASSESDSPPPLVLEPAADTSIAKLCAIWRQIRSSAQTPVFLALPGSGDVESRVLHRGR